MVVCLFSGKACRGQPLFYRCRLPLFSRWHPSGLCNEIAAWDKRHQGQISGRMFQPSRYRAKGATGGAGWFSGCEPCAWSPDKIALPLCPVLAEKPGIAPWAARQGLVFERLAAWIAGPLFRAAPWTSPGSGGVEGTQYRKAAGTCIWEGKLPSLFRRRLGLVLAQAG